MPKVSGIVAGFKTYGAKLANQNWAVSSLADGAVVMSLWKHKFEPGPGMVYRDNLSRWSGAGNNLFRAHLKRAFDEKMPVHLVMAVSSDPAAIDRGEDGSKVPKRFFVRPELAGSVETLVGDDFTIRFIEKPKT